MTRALSATVRCASCVCVCDSDLGRCTKLWGRIANPLGTFPFHFLLFIIVSRLSPWLCGGACTMLRLLPPSRLYPCDRPPSSCTTVTKGQFWRLVAQVSSSSPNWRIEVDHYDEPFVLVDVHLAMTYCYAPDYSWIEARRRDRDAAARRAATLRGELRRAARRRAPRKPKVLDPIGTPAALRGRRGGGCTP